MAQRKRPILKDAIISKYDARVERALIRSERAAAVIERAVVKGKKVPPKPSR